MSTNEPTPNADTPVEPPEQKEHAHPEVIEDIIDTDEVPQETTAPGTSSGTENG